MFEIVAAHGIERTATASVGYIQDLLNKVNKVKSVGWDFLHPCICAMPDRMGGAPSDSAIDIGKEVMDCGLWYRRGGKMASSS